MSFNRKRKQTNHVKGSNKRNQKFKADDDGEKANSKFELPLVCEEGGILLSQYMNVQCQGGVWKFRFGDTSEDWIGEFETEAVAVEARNEYYLQDNEYPGVHHQKEINKWLALYTYNNGVQEHLGSYHSFKEAVEIINLVESSVVLEETISDIKAWSLVYS